MHLDQLGQNDNKYAYSGQPIDLPNTFAGYVNNVKAAFPAGKKVTYNIVNGGVGTWGPIMWPILPTTISTIASSGRTRLLTRI
jgi:hypothetical protein